MVTQAQRYTVTNHMQRLKDMQTLRDVQRIRNTQRQGSTEEGMHKHLNTEAHWLHRHCATEIHGHTETGRHRYYNTEAKGYAKPQVH